MTDRYRRPTTALLGALCGLLWAAPAWGYITVPVATLGQLSESTYVTEVRVEKASAEKGVILFRKVRDLKGAYPKDLIRHVFDLKNTPAHKGPGDVPIRPDATDWPYALRWAAPGKTAVLFTRKYDPFGDFGHTYIDGCWYATMCPRRDWEFWYSIYTDPALLHRWHAGTPAQLVSAVETMLAGKDAVLPVLAEGTTKADLRLGRGKFRGLKVGPKIADFVPQRDLVTGVLDPAKIPELTKALQDPNPGVRTQAAHDLGLIGPPTKAVVPGLAAQLPQAAGADRLDTAEALLRLDAGNGAVVPALIAALQDPAKEARVRAADLLARAGPAAQPAVEALTKAVTGDPSGTVRISAADALAKIGPAARGAVPALEMALTDPRVAQRADVRAKLTAVIGQLK